MTQLLRMCGGILLVLGLCSSGCAPSLGEFDALADRGILPLSSDNPYLGANLFIGREAEQSTFLHEFLKERGGPSAIEVFSHDVSQPRVHLFYPKKTEFYVADRTERNGRTEWVVRGPYAIARRDFRQVSELARNVSDPVFVVGGRQVHFGRDPRTAVANTVLTPVVVLPTPAPTHKPVRRAAKATDDGSGEIITSNGFRRLNSDQQAIAISQGYAERGSSGEVIHNASGVESFSDIAKWYTGTPGNASAIAAENNMTSSRIPPAGTRISIPSKIVRQYKAMPVSKITPAPTPTPLAHEPRVVPPKAPTVAAAQPTPASAAASGEQAAGHDPATVGGAEPGTHADKRTDAGTAAATHENAASHAAEVAHGSSEIAHGGEEHTAAEATSPAGPEAGSAKHEGHHTTEAPGPAEH